MDGVLLIDKPQGPTSHDVVARLRRTSGERRIGHTGTLDPLATGLLPLVLGHATRLASSLSGSEKTYEATIRLGVITDTDDAEGQPMGPPTTALPRGDDVERVLPRFRGTFDQVPPRHSAKKVAGRRAYDLARAQQPVTLKPVSVTVRALDLIDWAAPDLLRLRVTASSGFYVRALARDLGEAAGCGAHLAALRRTRVGSFGVDAALPLDEAERLGREVASRLIPPAEALPDLPAVRVTDDGLKRVLHGNPIGPEGCVSVPSFIAASAAAPPLAVAPALEDPPSSSRLRAAVRLLAPDGRLVALAEPRQGFLHPVVVLGYH